MMGGLMENFTGLNPDKAPLCRREFPGFQSQGSKEALSGF